MTIQTNEAFATPIEELAGGQIAGPWRAPAQMLNAQEYDSHASIHDDATAQKLGFKGGTIEGPTHFSQFAPLGVALWGTRFLESGCISAHYRNAVFEGEKVRAFVQVPPDGATHTTIAMQKEDGTEVLRGSLSVGPENPPSALEARIKTLEPLDARVILADVNVGQKLPRHTVRMNLDQNMGALYPFSLSDKLKVITEPSPWYTQESGAASPYGRAIIPIEMISVLLNYAGERFPTRGPAVGLFADQEIRLLKGPLFVGEDYEVEREIVALSGSKRTESMWVKTRVFRPGTDEELASMLLNGASLKDSYARYQEELTALAS